MARPGIMIVNPRLHDPTPENAAMFMRWTKLHNRDLLTYLDVSHEDGCERIERAMRFSAAGDVDGYGDEGQDKDEEGKYGHENGKEAA